MNDMIDETGKNLSSDQGDRLEQVLESKVDKTRRKVSLLPIGIISALIIVAIAVLLIAKPWKSRDEKNVRTQSGDSRLNLYDKNGTQFLFEVPESRGYSGKTKGVTLFLHGCEHTAFDFWEKSEKCQKCLGLPVELELTELALKQGYIVLAVSSSNQKNHCWMGKREGVQSGRGVDYDNIKHALDAVEETLKRRGDKQPEQDRVLGNVVAFGISSGGFFAGMLPIAKNGIGSRITGLIPQISKLVPSWATKGLDKGSFPPVAFIHMKRDKKTSNDIKRNRKDFKSLKVKTAEFLVPPKAFTVAFCKKNLPKVGGSCKALVDNLVAGKVLSKKFDVIQDPRSKSSNWRIAAKSVADKVGDSLVSDKSGIMQMLNLARGEHEATSEYFVESLQWLDKQKHMT